MIFSFSSRLLRRPRSRLRLGRWALGVLLTISGLAGAQSARRLQAIDLVKEATVSFGRGDMSLVVKICRQALTLDPTYPRAYTWLGAAYQRRGETKDACAAFARVVKLAPGTPDALRSARGLRELGCANAGRAVGRGVDAVRTNSLLKTPPQARLENRWMATSGVASLAFSGDGRDLSGGGSDGAWRLWRLPDGALERLERGARYEIGAVASSPTFYAVGAGNGTIRFFKAQGGEEDGPITARSGAVSGLAFDGRGRFLAAAGPDQALKIFEARTHALLWQISCAGSTLGGAAFSLDGSLIAVGVGSVIRIYETRKGRLVRVLAGDGLPVNAVAWSRAGNWIAAASGYQIRVWSAGDGRLRRTLRGHRLTVTSLAFGSGATLASGGYDAQLRLWNVQSGAGSVLSLHRGQIRGVAFDSSGQRLASADQNGLVGLWRVTG